MHHVAFAVSAATFRQAVARLDARGIDHSRVKDRGFMDSIYFRDPLGLLIELASYRFEPPAGLTHVDVLMEAHRLRVAQRRSAHRRGAPGRCDRGPGAARAAKPVRGSLGEEPVLSGQPGGAAPISGVRLLRGKEMPPEVALGG